MIVKAFYFPDKENIDILKELRHEYITTDFLCFVNEVNFFISGDANNIERLSSQIFYVMDKVILDNIFKYVANKQPEIFLHHVSNNLFSKDIYISNFYISQILQLSNIHPDHWFEFENGVRLMLFNYIDGFMTVNFHRYQVPIMQMFEVMLNNFLHMSLLHYKFELVNNIKPMLLFTEKETLKEMYLYQGEHKNGVYVK